jgi:hypothetical protein
MGIDAVTSGVSLAFARLGGAAQAVASAPVAASPAAGPAAASAPPVPYATQLPDSMLAAFMAKADIAVMLKAMQAYEAAMQQLEGDAA